MIRGLVAATALAALAPAGSSTAQSVGPAALSTERQVTLMFDGRGVLLPSSAAARASLPAAAADRTDVFVLSHGWHNDARSAECRYQPQIKGIAEALPPSTRRLFVKIVWPSAMYPLPQDGCGAQATRPFFADQKERSAPDEVRMWAQAAFPAAARTRRFNGDVERLTAIMNLDAGAPGARSARTREAATILVGWRDAADGPAIARAPSVDGPGERAFAATVDQVVTAFDAIQNARFEQSLWTVVPSIAEVFSFWTMKSRAGVVGSTGVHDVLTDLAAQLPSSTRIHLVGHSFGGKLLAAAVVGRPGVEPNVVASLTILQGAFSHFAFSTADELRALGVQTSVGGAYADVLQRRLATVLAVTHSEQDRENQRWYPLAVQLSRDAFERPVPLYAALGARGLEGPSGVPVRLREDYLAARYSPSRPRVFDVDASGVILGHTDIMESKVFRMIADVVAVATRSRAAATQKQ
jgi:hypothetical protein